MTGLMDQIMTADHRSLIQLQLSEVNDRDSGKVHQCVSTVHQIYFTFY